VTLSYACSARKLYLMGQATVVTRVACCLAAPSASIGLPPSFRQNAIALSATLCQGDVLWRGVTAMTAAAIVFAAVNHTAGRHTAPKLGRDTPLVHHAAGGQQSFADRWDQAERDSYQSDEAFWNGSEEGGGVRLANVDAQEVTGAIVAGPSERASAVRLSSLGSGESELTANAREHGELVQLDEVEQYLWEVYQRVPTKRDGSGDFTWKDPAAAKRLGMPMPVYVIRGMDRDFREQLYHAGRAMDAAGIKWSILSGFRDDYRQHLASGFKASGGNSLHGGSTRTGGYGHGRAVDVTSMDEDVGPVWRWFDAHGAKYGLHRPMPGADPAHVQQRGEWRDLAAGLRQARIKAGAVASSAEPKIVASASR
jgi:hypothetical protein